LVHLLYIMLLVLMNGIDILFRFISDTFRRSHQWNSQ